MKLLLVLLLFTQFSFQSIARADEIKNVEDEISIDLSPESEALNMYTYNFGMLPVRYRHYARITITNNTQAEVRLLHSYIMGMSFNATQYCAKPLAPRASCLVELVFWPMDKGFHTGAYIMNFTNNNSIRFNLQGHAY